MAKPTNIEKFMSLSDAEKSAEIRRAVKAKSRPMTAAERKKWEKVQASLQARGRGRPLTGRGVKVISLSVEQGLLARADAQAKADGISRAALVAKGLEAILSRA